MRGKQISLGTEGGEKQVNRINMRKFCHGGLSFGRGTDLGLAVLYLFRADDSALEIREVASQAFGTNVESNVVASDAAPQEKTPVAE